MRISDWSSDVCSSDLTFHRGASIYHDLTAKAYEAGYLVNERGDDWWRINIPLTPALFSPGAAARGGHRSHDTQHRPGARKAARHICRADRTSVVAGTRVAVRVYVGRRRHI